MGTTMKCLVLAACFTLSTAGNLYGYGGVGITGSSIAGPAIGTASIAVPAIATSAIGAPAISTSSIAAPAITSNVITSRTIAAPAIATSAIAAPAIAAPAIAAPAAQGYAAGYGYAPAYGYSGPLNLNTQLVAHPNGAVVPVDEPAVAAARANHIAAGGGRAAPIVAASTIAAPAIGGYAAGYGYAGPQNLNTQLVAHPNGAVVPADEPAVAAARANHFAAGGGQAAPIVAAPAIAAPAIAASAIATPVIAAAGYNGYAAGYGIGGLVGHPNGAVVPVDEPAVAAARASHLAAKGGIY